VVFPPSIFTTPAHQDYAAFTPKFGLDYQVTDDAVLYLSATRGFKSGGFDYAVSSTANQIFAPEHVWSYEAGAKTDWFDKRLQINLTAFLYDYRNLQVQYLLGPGNIFIGNAPSATDKGIESEIIAKPVAGLTLTSNVSLLDATYDDGFIDEGVASSLIPGYINPGDPRFHSLGMVHGQQIGTYNAGGENLTNAPRFSTLESAQYDYDTGAGLLYGRVEYAYQSREYFDPTNVRILSQGAFGLWNLAIGYQGADSPWKFQALVKNVGDRQYLISAAALSNPPTGHAGDPRTLWFTVARQW
jgi:iron complex outermembrane receptor protein